MTPQEIRLIDYCKENGGITAWEAMKELGIMRLGARMFDLKTKYRIQTSWVEDVNRYGDKVRYKRYTILSKNKNNAKSIN